MNPTPTKGADAVTCRKCGIAITGPIGICADCLDEPQPVAETETPRTNAEIAQELRKEGIRRKGMTMAEKLIEVADWLIVAAPDNHIDARSICLDAVIELDAEKQKVREALEKYGRHTEHCLEYRSSKIGSCTCGFTKALTPIEPASKEAATSECKHEWCHYTGNRKICGKCDAIEPLPPHLWQATDARLNKPNAEQGGKGAV